jgi:hypothetical protein
MISRLGRDGVAHPQDFGNLSSRVLSPRRPHVAILIRQSYNYVHRAIFIHLYATACLPMSFQKFSWTCLLLAACTILSGCMKDAPSQSTYEEYFRTSIQGYDLYKDYFDIAKLEKLNGWKENEQYEIKGSAVLRARVGYLELLADVADKLEAQAKTDGSVGMTMGLGLMARGMGGENKVFREFWTQQQERKAIPAPLLARQAAMTPERFENLLQWSDQLVQDNYGAIISRQLKKGDELTRIYTLSFRQTEKGWMGFNAR